MRVMIDVLVLDRYEIGERPDFGLCRPRCGLPRFAPLGA
jgi:hypothetical protein